MKKKAAARSEGSKQCERDSSDKRETRTLRAQREARTHTVTMKMRGLQDATAWLALNKAEGDVQKKERRERREERKSS